LAAGDEAPTGVFRKFLPKAWLQKPLPNVWLMTSVETADYLWRIDEMLKAPAVAYGISVEPLLGLITLPERFLNLGKSNKNKGYWLKKSTATDDVGVSLAS
jgi:hypothetical protein